MTRRTPFVLGAVIALSAFAQPAFACGGLLSPNGSVNLLRTTTLAAYHNGIEHYVTSFRFVGGGGAKFGSIVPLPGIPSKVERAGDWTLQRLVREVRPVRETFAFAGADGAPVPASARVVLETKIDALDITVLEGGGDEVARWAEDNGFQLSPDAPEVLDFYASRSPIFMAARFDTKRAADQGLSEGDGTPIHLTIATPQPWVPLRILGLGKQPGEPVQADVFLLTDREPAMLPAAIGAKAGELVPRSNGMRLERSEWANENLLADLRSDRGMSWLPATGMWLSYITIDTPASDLRYDLALDASGAGQPSFVAAGLSDTIEQIRHLVAGEAMSWIVWLALAAAGGTVAGFVIRRRAVAGN